MTSQSMKSVSGLAPPVSKWRLKRTLTRRVEFRPIEDEDIKYLWAAYKQGCFDFVKRDMTAAEFKIEFEKTVVSHFHAAWMLFGTTRKGFLPVGLVLAAWAPNAPFLIISGAYWLPWASKRNIIECAVGFLSRIRTELKLQIYVLPEHKELYEICAKHGVVRRVGTSYVAIPGKAAAVFETTEKKLN